MTLLWNLLRNLCDSALYKSSLEYDLLQVPHIFNLPFIGVLMSTNVIVLLDKTFRYCEIINISWTFNFVYFVGRAIHEFKIPMK